MNAPVHFVIGTGRCGSSLAHEMICRHESVDFISNIQDRFGALTKSRAYNNRIFRALPPSASMKGRIRFAPSEGYEALAREVGPFVVDPYRDLLASDATDAVTTGLKTFFTVDSPERTLIHKFTGWPRARLLAEVFPDAKFVHVVRDPRAVVSSWLRMPWWRGHHGPDGWHFGPLTETQTATWQEHNESFAVLGALGWQIVIDAVDECRAVLGDRWLDVRYEDLCAAPADTLTEAIEHFDLSQTSDWLAQLTRYDLHSPRTGPGQWPGLDHDLAAVEQVCKRGMDQFSYEAGAQR